MNAWVVMLLMIHVLSHAVLVRRFNAGKNKSDQIAAFFIGPRSLSQLWRFLFQGAWMRSNDVMFEVAGWTHIVTTVLVFLGILTLCMQS